MHVLDAEVVFDAGLLEHREVALAAPTETEIVADDQVLHGQAAHEHLVDELLGC